VRRGSPTLGRFDSCAAPCRSELVREGLPGLRVAAAYVTSDDDAVLVEQRDGRLAEEPQLAGELSMGVEDRGPSPPVLSYEALGWLTLVVDVEADVLVLRMALDESCVGDRLAVANGSPGRPDVDEDGLAPQGR
jgi:hypothetical protein